MLKLIIVMLCGIAIGRLFSSRLSKINWGRIIFAIVLLLLFVMGVSIGANPTIINNLSTLGLEALIITGAAIFTSLVGAWILWRLVFHKQTVKEAE